MSHQQQQQQQQQRQHVVQSDIPQLTSHLRQQLRSYADFTIKINTTLKDVHQLQSELDHDMKPINLVKTRLDGAYNDLRDQTEEEIRRIDATLLSLDQLSSMQHAFEGVPSPVAPTSAAKLSRGPYKKRKLETNSLNPSPQPSAAPSPLPSPGSAMPRQLNLGLQAIPHISSAPASTFTQSSYNSPAPSTPTGVVKKITAKVRKDNLLSQLPLAPGRQVAFRQPSKSGPLEEKKDDWILARIVNCIQGDKNRYVVDDVDYDPANPTADGGRYHTTLKSIVPLPDPRDRVKTYPDHDFPPGTLVMALYPDTTSFYKAIIESGPEVFVEKGKPRKEIKTYNVKFDDDEDLVRSVPIELVAEIP